MVVVRVGGTGSTKLLDAQPCKHCLERLQSFGFDKIVYSNKEGNIVVNHLKNMKSTHLSNVQIRISSLSLPVYIPTILRTNNSNNLSTCRSNAHSHNQSSNQMTCC